MDIIKALQHLAYVKVCVEVTVDFKLPRFINVELRDDSFVFIRVEVPWLLMRCLQYRSFSHSDKYCSKKNEVKSAPNGGVALTLTFEVSSKGKVVVVDLFPTLKPKHVCFAGSSNRFETLSVELKDSNDVIDDDINDEQDVVNDDNETEQLDFSPRKPRLASLAVALLVRSLIATKQENLDKGKQKINNSPTKGREKGGGK
ncbi:hypothetical protein Goarm_010849, partial [Gossypium armourianum]|nr:hypothetical protein [Gossypium armourianum]